MFVRLHSHSPSPQPNAVVFFGALLLALATSTAAEARPTAPGALCGSTDLDIATCQGNRPACAMCHQGPPDLNGFGGSVAGALFANDAYTFDNFDELIAGAVAAVANDDSDGDGITNLEELALGTFPGSAGSFSLAVTDPVGTQNTFYDVGKVDRRFAHRRVATTFCGAPPTFDEVTAFADLADDAAQLAALHALLDTCLQSSFWRDFAVQRLGDAKIHPLEAISNDGLIPLADYGWDYRLFAYILTDDHDLRDLLLADYHVDENGNVVEGIVPIPNGALLETGGQPLPPERRAGMITTQWFLMAHTMFSALPRTTAAQAYRAYMGMDIAKGEGIAPVDGEPRDVDSKGVTEATCAVCHSTLDPLSYAFSPYNGIGRLRAGSVSRLDLTGSFDDARVPWGPEGSLLGTGVTSLRAWAEHAVTTDEFKHTLGVMLWRAAFARTPDPTERAEFEAIWRGLDGDDFSARRALHRVIDTNAFQVP